MNHPTLTVEAIERRLRLRARIALTVLAIGIPFVITGARAAVEGMRITPEKWAPPSHPQRQVFDEFRRQFEGNDVVLISWDGCTVDNPRLLRLEREILANNVLPSLDGAPFDRVESGYSAMRDLMSPPLNLSKEQALQRLTGVLVGPDGHTSCAIVVLTYEGNEHRRESIAHLEQIAAAVSNVPRQQLHVSGPPHDGVAIDDESIRGVNVFGTGSTVVSALFCLWFLQSWRIAGALIGIACFGQGVFLSLVHYAGWTLDAILIVGPPLVFLITVSAGIHLANYYVTQDKQLSEAEAVWRGLSEGARPCWLAATTTAIGLCSLSVSDVAPVRAFGMFAAASVMGTMAILMALLPDTLVRWPLAQRGESNDAFAHYWDRFSRRVSRWSTGIIIVGTALLATAAAGIPSLRTSVDAASLFASRSPIIRDYRWFESNIGPTVPIEVVVDFNADCPLGFHERAELVQTVEHTVRDTGAVGGVVSALTFMPELPSKLQGAAALRAALAYRRIAADRRSIVERHYLYEHDGRQSWRIGGRVSAMAGVNYGDLLADLKGRVEPLLNSPGAQKGIRVRYTGMMPLIQNVQVTILHDLKSSLLTAFAWIALAILAALRSFTLTCFATVLNMFPVLLVFGVMGLLEIPVDIGTMMTAGVALGIAVDDTVHFLCCYWRESLGGSSRHTAVTASVRLSGAAMLRTTVICTAGMLVFALSTFVPTRQFALMMAATLAAALAGDLLYLPALILSRLGSRITVTPGAVAPPPAFEPAE